MKFGLLTLFVAARSTMSTARSVDGNKDTTDETENLFERLTLTMGVDVKDDLSFTIRDATLGKAILSLANLDAIVGQEKACKERLAKHVAKQMVFWERVPDTEATEKEIDNTTFQHIIADVWTLEGMHIGHHLSSTGCATIVARTPNPNVAMSEPHIFATRADLQKAEKFEELRNLQEQIRKDAKVEAKRETAETEVAPMSVTGILCIFGAMMIFSGAMCDFGRKHVKRGRSKAPSALRRQKLH